MNIYMLRDNLKRTIAGKEAMLRSVELKSRQHGGADAMVSGATIGFLEINIEELRKILADVEICCQQATEDSWAANPDRSGA